MKRPSVPSVTVCGQQRAHIHVEDSIDVGRQEGPFPMIGGKDRDVVFQAERMDGVIELSNHPDPVVRAVVYVCPPRSGSSTPWSFWRFSPFTSQIRTTDSWPVRAGIQVDRVDSGSRTDHHLRRTCPAWDHLLVPLRSSPGKTGMSQPVSAGPGSSPTRHHGSKGGGEPPKFIYEVDPLVCVKCGSTMRIIACINDVRVIVKILDGPSVRAPRVTADHR